MKKINVTVIFVCVLICLQNIQYAEGAKCPNCSSMPIFRRLACRLEHCAEETVDSSPKVESNPKVESSPKEESNPKVESSPKEKSNPKVESSPKEESKFIVESSDKTLITSPSKEGTPNSINQEIHPIGGVV